MGVSPGKIARCALLKGVGVGVGGDDEQVGAGVRREVGRPDDWDSGDVFERGVVINNRQRLERQAGFVNCEDALGELACAEEERSRTGGVRCAIDPPKQRAYRGTLTGRTQGIYRRGGGVFECDEAFGVRHGIGVLRSPELA
ncbi:hypothetical protein ABWH91_03220 [Phycisphaerales bacterium ac7]